MGVEPTVAVLRQRPPVLRITKRVLTGYENSLLYLILQSLTGNGLLFVLSEVNPL